MSSPVKSLLGWSVVWLPLCFAVWFYLAAVLVAPTGVALNALLPAIAPQTFLEIVQTGYIFDVQTLVPFRVPSGADAGKMGALAITVNPMIYAYGLPLIAGLILATPLSTRRRIAQIGAGVLAMILVQTWGAFWDAMKTVAFNVGPAGATLIQRDGLNRELIALCYQFGYLILPAVVPVVLWLGMNRRYIETLSRRNLGTQARS